MQCTWSRLNYLSKVFIFILVPLVIFECCLSSAGGNCCLIQSAGSSFFYHLYSLGSQQIQLLGVQVRCENRHPPMTSYHYVRHSVPTTGSIVYLCMIFHHRQIQGNVKILCEAPVLTVDVIRGRASHHIPSLSVDFLPTYSSSCPTAVINSEKQTSLQ